MTPPDPVDTDRIIEDLIVREGGYVNHPLDRGGPTRFGITAKTLARWRGAEVTAGDVRALTQAEARAIYLEEFVVRPGFFRIGDIALRAQLIDAAALHGPGWTVRRLQEVAGLAGDQIDGILGPITAAAVNGSGPGLANRFAARRIRKLARIVAADPSQLVFLTGWIGRATSFLES